MTPLLLGILLCLAVAQLSLPRKWAFMPLLIAACHLGNGELFSQISPPRAMILLGLARAAMTGNLVWNRENRVDVAVAIFAIVALLVSAVPRADVPSPFSQNLGLILNVAGTYLYGRAYLSGEGVLIRFTSGLAVIVVALGSMLVLEQRTGKNPYSSLGIKSEFVNVREGRNRAMGPFRHPILAGTAGATSMPLMLILFRRRRALALIGMGGCLMAVLGSSSSGPLAALAAGTVAMSLWRYRDRVRTIKWAVIFALVIMHFVSTRGVWYLMAHMDLVGGSTGYHRAKLIDSALGDFSSWWLAGTDYTRTWMFSGVSWSDRHTDLTNYYLHIGVIGGIGLLGALLWILFVSFQFLGRRYLVAPVTSQAEPERYDVTFHAWCLGSAIFAHAVSFLSVSYFDQMYVLFYLALGIVPGLFAPSVGALEASTQDEFRDGLPDPSLSGFGDPATT